MMAVTGNVTVMVIAMHMLIVMVMVMVLVMADGDQILVMVMVMVLAVHLWCCWHGCHACRASFQPRRWQVPLCCRPIQLIKTPE